MKAVSHFILQHKNVPHSHIGAVRPDRKFQPAKNVTRKMLSLELLVTTSKQYWSAWNVNMKTVTWGVAVVSMETVV